MKIVITVNTYYPLTDGVQNVTEYLAEGLVKLGHKVTVLTTNANNIEKEVYSGVEIVRFDIRTKHTLYFGNKIHYIEYLLELVDKSDVLINVCTQNPMTDIILPYLKDIKCKKILYLHGMYDMTWNFKGLKNIKDLGHKIWNNIRWGIYYRKSRIYFEEYDKVIQLHEMDYANIFFYKKYGIKSEVIYNAAEEIFFEQKKVNKEKYLLYVANYMDGKNQKMVLKAFLNANISNDISLVFIGSRKNKYYNELVDLYNKLCPAKEKKVNFLYGVSRSLIPYWVSNSYLCLMGSKGEKFPMSIVEAMACGIPYISTDVGCIKYFPGGMLVQSEEEMTKDINLLCEDCEEYKRLSSESRNFAINNFKIVDKVKQLEKIILE